MSKTVYLHIGTHKTGTTSIQEYLRRKRGDLAAQNIFSPEGELKSQHVLPVSLVLDNSKHKLRPRPQHSSGYYWNMLKSQIKDTNCKNIIISSEVFCDFTHPAIQNREFFSSFLKNFFKDYNVKVICYIRNIFSYIESFYQEMVKNGVGRSFTDVVNEFIRTNSFHAFPKQILDFYSGTFGRESLIIREYNVNKLKNSDIISDFFDILNLNVENTDKMHVNLGLPDEYILHKMLFNTLKFNDLDFNREISDILIQQKELYNRKPIDYTKIINNAKELKEEYDIDNLNNKTMCKFEETHISETYVFIITLLSYSIKQNKEILSKLDQFLSNNK